MMLRISKWRSSGVDAFYTANYLAAVLCLCSVLSFIRAQAAAPGPKELQVRADRLFIAASVNGHGTEALLDSAAEATLIDPTWAKSLGLVAIGGATARGSGGQVEAKFVPHVTIRAAGCELKDLTVALVDFTDISQRLVGRPVQLVLGREIFDAARLSIDIEGGRIGVLDRSGPVAGFHLPLNEHAGIESFPVELEGLRNVAADFDLGNGSDVMIGKRFALAHGLLRPERIIAHEKSGGLGGATLRDVIVLKRLVVAGHEFRDVRAVVDAMDNAGDLNLGVKILRNFSIVVDFAQRSIWLAPRVE